MRPTLRHGAIALALLALAITWRGEFDRWRADVGADETTGSLGAISAQQPFLPLTDEERARVFDGIMRIPNVPVADVAAPEPNAALPGSVELQQLPTGIAHEIPRVQDYKFVKLDDRILLVHPNSRMVVAEMPRYKLVVQ